MDPRRELYDAINDLADRAVALDDMNIASLLRLVAGALSNHQEVALVTAVLPIARRLLGEALDRSARRN